MCGGQYRPAFNSEVPKEALRTGLPYMGTTIPYKVPIKIIRVGNRKSGYFNEVLVIHVIDKIDCFKA